MGLFDEGREIVSRKPPSSDKPPRIPLLMGGTLETPLDRVGPRVQLPDFERHIMNPSFKAAEPAVQAEFLRRRHEVLKNEHDDVILALIRRRKPVPLSVPLDSGVAKQYGPAEEGRYPLPSIRSPGQFLAEEFAPRGPRAAKLSGLNVAAGAASGAAGIARVGQGVFRELSGEPPPPPPHSTTEFPVADLARFMFAGQAPESGEYPQIPGAADLVETASYPLRKAIAAGSRASGLSDAEFLYKLAPVMNPRARPSPTGKPDVERLGDAMGAVAEGLEQFAGKSAAEVDAAMEGWPWWAKTFVHTARGGTSAAVSIGAGFHPLGKLLAATKVPGAPLLTLPAFEYLRAVGAGEPRYPAAVHGMVLQGGLSLAALTPAHIGTPAGVAMFGGPAWKEVLAGRLTVPEAISESIIGGYFGLHGSRMHQKRQLMKAYQKLGVERKAAEAEIDALMEMRPEVPRERLRGGPGPGGTDRPQERFNHETGKWMPLRKGAYERELEEGRPEDAQPPPAEEGPAQDLLGGRVETLPPAERPLLDRDMAPEWVVDPTALRDFADKPQTDGLIRLDAFTQQEINSLYEAGLVEEGPGGRVVRVADLEATRGAFNQLDQTDRMVLMAESRNKTFVKPAEGPFDDLFEEGPLDTLPDLRPDGPRRAEAKPGFSHGDRETLEKQDRDVLEYLQKEGDQEQLAEWQNRPPTEEDVWQGAQTGVGVRLTAWRASGREDVGEVYAPGAEGPALGDAYYYGLSEESVKRFGPDREQREVELDNPVVIESDQQLRDLAGGRELPYTAEEWSELLPEIRQEILDRGHDGAIVNISRFGDVVNNQGRQKRLKEVFGQSQVVDFRKRPPREAEPDRWGDDRTLSLPLTVHRPKSGVYKSEATAKAAIKRKKQATGAGEFEVRPVEGGYVIVEHRPPGTEDSRYSHLNRDEAREVGAEEAWVAKREEVKADEQAWEEEDARQFAPRDEDLAPLTPEEGFTWESAEESRGFLWGPRGDAEDLSRPDTSGNTVATGTELNEISLSDGTVVTTRLGFADARDLVPSHIRAGGDLIPNPEYPHQVGVQNREYSAEETQLLVSRAAPGTFDENQTYRPSGSPEMGPIIVWPVEDVDTGLMRLIVAGHNGGAITARERTTEALNESAKRWADAYGLAATPEFGFAIDMQRPVPVQIMVDRRPQSRDEAARLGSLLNESAGREQRSHERARLLSASLSDKFLEVFNEIVGAAEPGVSLRAVVGNSKRLRDALREEIPEKRRGAFFEKGDRLSDVGMTEFENAILDRVVGDHDLVNRMGPDLRNRLVAISPAILRGQRIAPGFLEPIVEAAIESEIHRTATGQKVDDFIDQVDLFAQEQGAGVAKSQTDHRVAAVHRALAPHQAGGDAPTLARDRFSQFEKTLYDDATGALDLFGSPTNGDPNVAFDRAFLSAQSRPDLKNEPEPAPELQGERVVVEPGQWQVGDRTSVATGKVGSRWRATVIDVTPGEGRKKARVTYEYETDKPWQGKRQKTVTMDAFDKLAERGVRTVEPEPSEPGPGKVQASVAPIEPRRNRHNSLAKEGDSAEEIQRRIQLSDDAEGIVKQGPGEFYRGHQDVNVADPDVPIPPRIVRRGEVLELPFKFFGWTIDFGRLRAKGSRFGERVMGFHQTGTGWMKVRDWYDFQTAFHELGHRVADHFPELKEIFRLDDLGPESYEDPSLPPHIREMIELSYERTEPAEGFAEGLRHVLSNSTWAIQKTPHFNATMETWFNSRPKREREMWNKVRRDAHEYFEQGSGATLADKFSATHAPVWAAYNTSLDRFRRQYVDAFHGIANLEMAVTGRLADAGAFFFSRMQRGVPWMADRINMDGWPVWTGNGVEFAGKALKGIVARALGPKPSVPLVENFVQYYHARRAESLSEADRIVSVQMRALMNAEEVASDPDVKPQYASMPAKRILVQYRQHPHDAVERVLGRDVDVDEIWWPRDPDTGETSFGGKMETPTPERPLVARYIMGYRDRPTGKEYSQEEYNLVREAARAQAEEEGSERGYTEGEVDSLADEILASKIGGAKTGLTPAEIEGGLGYGKQHPEFEKGYDELVEFNEKVADFAQDLGLVSQGQRDMWPWADYATSFSREMEGPQPPRGGGGNKISTQRPIHMLRNWRGRAFKDPLTRLYEGPARIIHMALENHARQKIAALLVRGEDLFKGTRGGGLFGGEIKAGSKEWTEKISNVREAIVDQVKKNLGEEGIEIPDDFLQEAWLPDAITFFRGGQQPKDPHVMTVFMPDGKGGVKPRYFEIQDPSLIDAMQHFRKRELGTFERVANTMRRVLQTSVTRGPDFMAGQLARDPVTNITFSRVPKQWLLTTIQGYTEALKFAANRDSLAREAIWNLGGGGTLGGQGLQPQRGLWAMDSGGALREGTVVSKAVNWAARKTGVTNWGTDYRRARSLVKHAQRENVGVSRRGRMEGRVPDPSLPIRMLDSAIMVTEMGPRLGEVIRAKRAGKSGFELGKYYREASVDFAQGGNSEIFHYTTLAVPFLRAQIASWDRVYRGVGIGEGIRGAAAVAGRHNIEKAFEISAADADMKTRTAMMILAQSFASAGLAAHNMVNVDDYRNESPTRKALYNFVYIPTGTKDDGSVEYQKYMMPRAYDTGMFAAFADLWMENMLESDDPEAMSHGRAMLWGLEHNFGIGLPPALNALAKYWANKDTFTGSPVLSADIIDLPAWQQTRPDTSRTMAWVGKASKEGDWPFEVSPVLWESLMESFFATIPSMALGVLDKAFFDVPTRPWSEVPGARRFIGPASDTRTRFQRDFYEFREAAQKASNSRRRSRRDRETDELEAMRGTLEEVMAKSYKRLNAISERISRKTKQIDKMARKAESGGPYDPDYAAAQKLKGLREREDMYRQGVEFVEARRRDWREKQ